MLDFLYNFPELILDMIIGSPEFLINRPILILAIMVLPLFLTARHLKLFPSNRMLYLAAIPFVLSIAMSQFLSGDSQLTTIFLYGILAVDALLLLFVFFDACMTPRENHFSCSRTIGGTGSQGKKYPVQLRVVNRGKIGCNLILRDDLPPGFTVTPSQFNTRLRGQSNTEFEYQYVSDQRGKADLHSVYLKVASPLKFWRAFYEIPTESSVNVYPDIKQISEYDLLARTNRLSLLGMRRSRSIGQDNEFERLRDYTQDDNYKHIDWRSTARRQKLTVRDFQANQSQQIIFMIDCGRMMTGTHEKTDMIDHAINSMLMLSYVALRRGDSVGLITFSNKVHNFIPPKAGVKHINRLLHATFNQSATHVESRFDQAFLYLRNKCPKRSLVVTITNLIDEINSSQVKKHMSVLTGRHLPFAVLLRDHSMFDAIDEFENSPPAQRDHSLYEAAAAASILTWRNQLINDLKHQGVLTMDVFPEGLTANLVNRYLDIKARHLL